MSEMSGPSQFRIKLGAPTAQDVPALGDDADLEISKVSKDPEEMKFRVRELPFPPEGAYLWRSNEGRPATPPLAPIVVAQDVLRAANAHVSQSDEYEIGGFLLGNRCRCPDTGVEYVIIDQVTEAKHTQATPTSLKFTTETWSQLKDDLSGKFVGKLCVGWYHSHPKMDVFLSGYDEAVQKTYFSEPWNSALVIEPTKRRGGFFCWRAEGMNLNTPEQFYELLERNSDATVLDWMNYECVDQRTGEVIKPPVAAPPPSAGGDPHAQTSAGQAAGVGEPGGAPAFGRPTAAGRREERLRGRWSQAAFILGGVAALVLVATATFFIARSGQVAGGPPPPPPTPENEFASGIKREGPVRQELEPPDSLKLSMTLTGCPPNPIIEVDGREAQVDMSSSTPDGKVEVEVVANLQDKLDAVRRHPSAEVKIEIKVMDRQSPETHFLSFRLPIDPRIVRKPAPVENDNDKPSSPPKPKTTPRRQANVNQANVNSGGGQPTPVSPTPSSSPNPAQTPQPQATPANPSPSASPAGTPSQPQQSPPPSSKEKKEQLEKAQKGEESRLEVNQKAQREFLKVEKERRLRLASNDDEKRRLKSEFETREAALKTSQSRERENMKARHKAEREQLKGEQQRAGVPPLSP